MKSSLTHTVDPVAMRLMCAIANLKRDTSTHAPTTKQIETLEMELRMRIDHLKTHPSAPVIVQRTKAKPRSNVLRRCAVQGMAVNQ